MNEMDRKERRYLDRAYQREVQGLFDPMAIPDHRQGRYKPTGESEQKRVEQWYDAYGNIYVSGGTQMAIMSAMLKEYQKQNEGLKAVILDLETRYSRTVKEYPNPKVIHHMIDGTTVVIWEDGTKTMVKKRDTDSYDPYAATAQAFLKKIYGSTTNAKRILHDISQVHVKSKKEKKREAKEKKRLAQMKNGRMRYLNNFP